MKIFFLFILMLSLVSCSTKISEDFLSQIKIKYYSPNLSPQQLVDSTYQYYPRYLNFSVDTSYRPSYPNPFSPSIFATNLFHLKDSSSIKLELLDDDNKLISTLFFDHNPPGYYLLSYSFKSLLDKDQRNTLFHSNIKFSFCDSTYVVPLMSI